MKYIVYGVTSVVIIVLIILCIMTIEGKTSKQDNLDRSLQNSVEDSIANLVEAKKYTINDSEEFVADACQLILSDISKGKDGKEDPNLQVDITVSGIDYEKGLIMLYVEETFTDPDGELTKAQASCTAVLDKDIEEPTLKVNYYINGVIYRTFECAKGDDFPTVNVPASYGDFDYWLDKKTNEVVIIPDTLDSEYNLEAVFK
ncbi:MAG: hypothetical protein E7279_01580 [Lachnospiraceae bacterium]|nr:hypothetical protein [Lachnospiraceae bacterium]